MSDIPRAANPDTCRRWDVPQLDEGGHRTPGADTGQRAWEEGFEQGRMAGLAAGREQVQAQLAIISQLLQVLATPLAELDDRIEKELVALAMSIARQVVYRELRTDPELVLAAVKKALAVLPVGAREVCLYVHPDDARLVRELFPPEEGETGWQIIEEPAQDRGDCRISTPTSEVDATLDTRLARVAASVLGESGESA